MQNNLSPIVSCVETPLVIMSADSKSRLIFTKYWVETKLEKYYFLDTLWQSTCTIKKSHRDASGSLDLSMLEEWTKPSTQRVHSKGIVVLLYDQETCKLIISSRSVDKFSPRDLQQEQKENNYLFANNPMHAFTWKQARSIWTLLGGQSLHEDKLPEMETFLNTYPGVNKVTQEVNCPEFKLWSRLPSHNFPTTIEQAIAAHDSVVKQTNQKDSKERRPTPEIVKQQPTEQEPAQIHLVEPCNHGSSLTKNQPTGLYNVWVHYTEGTRTKAQREVIYAQPTEENPKNLNKERFPLCSPKSTVAVLCWDSNPLSKTYQQPIIISINHIAETSVAVQKFLDVNASFLSLAQKHNLSRSLPNLNHSNDTFYNQPTEETAMIESHCKFCNSTFFPTRPNNLYCSPSCRLSYHAGKTFGKSERVQRTPAHSSPQENVNLQKEISRSVLYGIKFPCGRFYTGAQYTDNGQVHSREFIDMPWRAKSYSPAKITELLALFPKVFEGCVMAELEEYD